MSASETSPDAPFHEPWQAQLFALTVAMNERGHFTWTEWTEVFGPRVQNASEEVYWEIWAGALETLLEARGVAAPGALDLLKQEWQDAARATPHGEPIVLEATKTRA